MRREARGPRCLAWLFEAFFLVSLSSALGSWKSPSGPSEGAVGATACKLLRLERVGLKKSRVPFLAPLALSTSAAFLHFQSLAEESRFKHKALSTWRAACRQPTENSWTGKSDSALGKDSHCAVLKDSTAGQDRTQADELATLLYQLHFDEAVRLFKSKLSASGPLLNVVSQEALHVWRKNLVLRGDPSEGRFQATVEAALSARRFLEESMRHATLTNALRVFVEAVVRRQEEFVLENWKKDWSDEFVLRVADVFRSELLADFSGSAWNRSSSVAAIAQEVQKGLCAVDIETKDAGDFAASKPTRRSFTEMKQKLVGRVLRHTRASSLKDVLPRLRLGKLLEIHDTLLRALYRFGLDLRDVRAHVLLLGLAFEAGNLEEAKRQLSVLRDLRAGGRLLEILQPAFAKKLLEKGVLDETELREEERLYLGQLSDREKIPLLDTGNFKEFSNFAKGASCPTASLVSPPFSVLTAAVAAAEQCPRKRFLHGACLFEVSESASGEDAIRIFSVGSNRVVREAASEERRTTSSEESSVSRFSCDLRLEELEAKGLLRPRTSGRRLTRVVHAEVECLAKVRSIER